MKTLKNVIVLSLILTSLVSFAAKAENTVKDLNFDVVRNGEKIGIHQIHFTQNGQNLNVSIQTDVEVKVMFITAYKFHHRSTEQWKSGLLQHLQSQTDDDGTAHRLDITRDGDVLSGQADGERIQVSHSTIPASLWNLDILKSASIINTLEGHEMKVRVEHMGRDPLLINERKQITDHYRLMGELERELWFNEAGRLVQVRFKGSDGSDIIYKRV